MKVNLANNNHGRIIARRLIILLAIICFFMISIVIGLGYFFEKEIFSEMEQDVEVDTSKYDVTVTAEIIDNEIGSVSVSDDYESDTYLPIYKYEYKGDTYTARGSLSSTTKEYEVGDKTEVRISSADPSQMYDPNYNSKEAYDEFKSAARMFMIGPIIFMVIAILFVLAIIVFGKKKH